MWDWECIDFNSQFSQTFAAAGDPGYMRALLRER
jgi:hypothetical protein